MLIFLMRISSLTEFSSCSATHLEQSAWESVLYDHQPWIIRSSTENSSVSQAYAINL